MDYDAWLERPFQQAAEESERFYDWCEEHNIDPDDKNAEFLYQEWIDEMYDFEPNYDYDVDDDWLEADYEDRNGVYDD